MTDILSKTCAIAPHLSQKEAEYMALITPGITDEELVEVFCAALHRYWTLPLSANPTATGSDVLHGVQAVRAALSLYDLKNRGEG